MSFGGFLENSTSSDGGGGGRLVPEILYSKNEPNNNNIISNNINMPSTAIAQPRLLTQSLTKSMFNSPGLSLALQTNIDGQGGDMLRNMSESFEPVGGRRGRDELEHDISRSGSDNMDGGSGDDLDAADKPPRKKRYHRHTPQQIQELEALFKECPHPDEKQRLELSKRLCLETRQVKFWFQNRRTQMKTQLERHENSLLRQENDKLRGENMSIRDAMRNPICSNCGGPAIIGEISIEEQHLRIENARLKDELERVCALAGKFLGRPISSLGPPPLPSSALELGVGGNGFGPIPGAMPDFVGSMSMSMSVSGPLPVLVSPPGRPSAGGAVIERSMYLELALAAMEELVKMAQSEDPLWVRSGGEGGREVLNEDEYMRSFNPCIGMKPNGFVTEASRESGIVIINSLALVETLMDSNRWAEMFPCLIARTTTTDVISSGMAGTRNGALQLMHAELQVLSPLVPVREVNFLRFCKQHAEGVWAVVDVSIDAIRETSSGGPTFLNCRRLPSGCVVQDMPSGYSKVTWVEHAEYDESQVHQLYHPLLSSGMGFGAQRWVATLQRQCECLAILMSSTVPTRDHTAGITPGGRRSMLKLAQRMTDNFCAGVCASTVHKWNKLNAIGNVDEDVRVMTRKSVDDPGEPPGIVLSAATSVWLPVSPNRLFDFLRDERLRSEWDILSNGGPMQEMAHIAKGQDHGNCVSLLRASTNLIKESIRMGYNDFGDFYYAHGALGDAFKHYVRTRDYCTTAKHIIHMCLNSILVSIEMGQFTHVTSYVAKAEQSHDSIDPITTAKIRCAAGLSHLESRKYKLAARKFLETAPELGNQYNEVISPQDVATYGGLCALASFDWAELKNKVIDNLNFRNFLELVPEVRELINDFYSSHYASCLDYLGNLKANLLLDIHLFDHVETLYDQIRSKALIQYTHPFVSVDLHMMANAFKTNIAGLEKELEALITDNQIQARIDSHNKILYARHADQRNATFQRVLQTGSEFDRDVRSMLLRANLIKHEYNSKAARKQ